MKQLLYCLLPLLMGLFACNQPTDSTTNNPENNNLQEPIVEDNGPVYDSLLAQELGADDYGMRKYVLAFLKKGPNRPTDPEEAKKLQAAHMENIGRLAEEGKLALAGPFLDDGDLRGVYIFAVETIEEAEALTNTDPAIQAGSLIMELHPWYGSAGVMRINSLHNKIVKQK